MYRVPALSVIWLIYLLTEQGVSAKSRFKSHDVIAPTSDSNTKYVNEMIPRECQELGFCEVSKHYPEELMSNLINQLEEVNMTIDDDDDDDKSPTLYDEEIYGDSGLTEDDITMENSLDRKPQIVYLRSGFDSDDGYLRNPCGAKEMTIRPLMVRSLLDGQWYYVLNSRTNPIQRYNVQICKKTNPTASSNMKCDPVFSLTSPYESQCVQKFMTQTTIVVKENETVLIPVHIPCCCSCVAV